MPDIALSHGCWGRCTIKGVCNGYGHVQVEYFRPDGSYCMAVFDYAALDYLHRMHQRYLTEHPTKAAWWAVMYGPAKKV